MVGTFGSLNIAKTGLQAQQVVIDVTSNNISNVSTEDYVRRRAALSEVGGGSNPTMWSEYIGHGEGVTTTAVQRLTDYILDTRVRTETGTQSYLTAQQSSLNRIETALGEPGDNGISNALNEFIQAWQEVVSNPGGEGSESGTAARQVVLAKAQVLTAALNTQARNIIDEQSNMFVQAQNDLLKVNTDAAEIAKLNHTIYVGQASGTDVHDLEDKRDALILDLASLTGSTATQREDGRYDISINGQKIVEGDFAGTMYLTDSNFSDPVTRTGWSGEPLKFAISDPVTGERPQPPYDSGSDGILDSLGGDLGGIAVLLGPTSGGNRSLTDFMNGLNTLAKQVIDTVNSVLSTGYNAYGLPGSYGPSTASSVPVAAGSITAPDIVDNGGFFVLSSTDPGFEALNVHVNDALAADPNLIAVSTEVPDGLVWTPPAAPTSNGTATYDASNADLLYQALNGSSGYPSVNGVWQTVVTNMGAAIDAINTQVSNQDALTQQVSNERQQQAGISLDEETINLMQAERAYQASARVLSTMDSILDTLINGM